MNTYLELQIKNMITSVQLFDSACELAAKKDDGQIDRDEEKQLRIIHKAAKRFVESLEKAESR